MRTTSRHDSFRVSTIVSKPVAPCPSDIWTFTAPQAFDCDRDADVRFAETELRRRGNADVKVADEAEQGTLL